MNKLSKIFLIIIIILLVALGIMTYKWWEWRTTAFKRSYELYQVRDIWNIPPYTIDENGTIMNTVEYE